MCSRARVGMDVLLLRMFGGGVQPEAAVILLNTYALILKREKSPSNFERNKLLRAAVSVLLCAQNLIEKCNLHN